MTHSAQSTNRRGSKKAAAKPTTTTPKKMKYFRREDSLGYLLAMQGRFDDALAEYRKAVGERPDFRMAHFHKHLAAYGTRIREQKYRIKLLNGIW